MEHVQLYRGNDAYTHLAHQHLSIPVPLWRQPTVYQEGEGWDSDCRMAGSTSDDQSVFDAPTACSNGDKDCDARQSPESSASPPNSMNVAPDPKASHGDAASTSQAQNPKQKRIACIICRRRKLKCDGARPRCSTCARLKHECGYDETRKKSGPKRGYVKELEKRLKQIETQLKSDGQGHEDSPSNLGGAFKSQGFDPTQSSLSGGLFGSGRSASMDPSTGAGRCADESGEGFPWEMIGLGLEEPLPPQEIVNELHSIYFDKLHTSMPMIHKYRYLAAMNLAPNMRPPIALRYAIWAYACSATDKFQNFQEMFYQRARKYAEIHEMKGFGEQVFTVGHVQAWVIIANYELKMLYFPRAWMSVGRAVRLAQMLGLYRVDGGGLEVKECLGPPKDWVDREERRRTFWAAYCFDRWVSIGTGWPVNIDERDIHTDLPVPDDAFDKGKQEQGLSLPAILKGIGDMSKLSSYTSVILMASIIGKTLTHLHRTDGSDDAQDAVNGEFWKRHEYLDHILTNTTVCLPEHLRLVEGMTDPNVIFLHMNIQSTVICLHQAAILKAEQNDLDQSLIKDSTERCYIAATEIANIWRKIGHLDISFLSPYVAFCLFVAARVFVHSYKKHPDDISARSSLHFLLNAMEAHRKRNDITESFLMQLLVDLDKMGFESVVLKRHQAFVSKREPYGVYQEGTSCVAVLQRHSDKQPSFQDFQTQAETQRMSAMYAQGNSPGLDMDSGQLNMPIRPGMPGNQMHSVSLGHDYDINVQYTNQQGLSPNGPPRGFTNQPGFTLPSHSSPSSGHSPAAHNVGGGMANDGQQGQHGDFFSQGDFDISMLNGAFDMTQDPGMMQDLQNTQWNNVNNNFPDGTQSTPAAAWAHFI